ncbi:hypothetical protein H2203_002404 [Taxawa tesnikishii (nom. ined.)]|nr:hypothetical protein H2203_002404 [Dothideales sp. JES 119]
MSAPRRLLVAGATGKQGGAVIRALLSESSQPFHIYALTRDKTSRGARALTSKPNISVIEGDLNDCTAIFKQIEHPWGVFSVQLPLPNAEKEEQYGKALTAAAVEAGVQHIVYTSADRGGNERSEQDPTSVPHFVSKFNIERDLQQKAAASKQGMTWTILRPVAFMENLTPDFIGKAFATMWYQNGRDRKLQLISSEDVGKVAADAFLNAESTEYRNRSLSLAGDELSPAEANKIFQSQTGKDMPTTFGLVGSAIRLVLREQLGIMFDWFKAQGFGADVAALKKRYPGMQDFSTWLRESSGFRRA